ncbi:MAG: hypothetical protein WDO72_08605 [Pseudomonadota bacterium]
MNQQQIEQYVAGKMSQAQAEAFEHYCLENPEFAKQVEFEQRLKTGLAQVARGSTAEFVRSNHPMRWRLAAAAAVLLCLAAGFYAFRANPDGAQPLLAAIEGKSPHVGTTMRLAMVRGADTAPALQKGLVRVEIVGLFDTGVHYVVSLDRLEPKKEVDTLATLYALHASSPMSLEVVIDSDRLERGAYSLRVRKQSSDEEPLDFGFVKF